MGAATPQVGGYSSKLFNQAFFSVILFCTWMKWNGNRLKGLGKRDLFTFNMHLGKCIRILIQRFYNIVGNVVVQLVMGCPDGSYCNGLDIFRLTFIGTRWQITLA